MIKAAIEKICDLAKPSMTEINGESFCDKALHHIKVPVAMPDTVHLSSLDSLCDMVRAEAVHQDEGIIFVHAKNYRTVYAWSEIGEQQTRKNYYCADADVPEINFNRWTDHQTAVIQIQSLYIPNADTEYLLNLLSCITQESKVQTGDNGVSQRVQASSGIALSQMVTVKPYVNLQPFRTFLEVEQPESRFLLRVDDGGKVALFEADGGVWKMEAARSIAKHLKERLADLVEDGSVVILR